MMNEIPTEMAVSGAILLGFFALTGWGRWILKFQFFIVVPVHFLWTLPAEINSGNLKLYWSTFPDISTTGTWVILGYIWIFIGIPLCLFVVRPILNRRREAIEPEPVVVRQEPEPEQAAEPRREQLPPPRERRDRPQLPPGEDGDIIDGEFFEEEDPPQIGPGRPRIIYIGPGNGE
jgi:hypothetical protein